MVDVILRSGTVVDGAGRPRYRADVAGEASRSAAVYVIAEVSADRWEEKSASLAVLGPIAAASRPIRSMVHSAFCSMSKGLSTAERSSEATSQGWPTSNRNGRDQIGIGGRLHPGHPLVTGFIENPARASTARRAKHAAKPQRWLTDATSLVPHVQSSVLVFQYILYFPTVVAEWRKAWL